MFDTRRNPLQTAIDALGRGADAAANIPQNQQARKDIHTAREQELTDEARQQRMDMLADLYEQMSQLDENDPEDADAIQLGNQLIQELLDELDLTGEEAVRSLGRGTVTTTQRQTIPGRATTGAGATIEGTGQSLVPNVRATITREREIPVAQGLATVGRAAAAAERRRELEAEERQFEHQEFMTRLGFDLEGVAREDVQEFERLMAEAEREFERGQLSTQIAASLKELLARLGHEVEQNELNRELEKYLQEQAQEHELALHDLKVSAETNLVVEGRLHDMALALFNDPEDPKSQAEIERFKGLLQGSLARGEITRGQAESLAFLAEVQTGLKRENFLAAVAERQQSEFEARAAEIGVNLAEAEAQHLVGQWTFEDAKRIHTSAFEAANAGDITALEQIKTIATLGTEAGYTEAQVEAARAVMGDMPMLEARAQEVLEQADEYRRLALQEAKLKYDTGVINQLEARNLFARSAAGTFDSLEEATEYLDNLKPSEKAALGLDTPEGRQGFLAQVDYALVKREEGEWAMRVDAMAQTPVDSDAWEDQFVFAATMADMPEGVARQVAAGLRRVAQNEDDMLQAQIGELNARAQLSRANAGKDGSGSEAFKVQVDSLKGLLQSLGERRQQACSPVDMLGEEPRIDQAACSLAMEEEEFWQGVLADVIATGGVAVPERVEVSPEDRIRRLAEGGMAHEEFPATVWATYPGLEEELFPDQVQGRREENVVPQRSAGQFIRDETEQLEAQNRAVASVFQGVARWFSGNSKPTLVDRDRWQHHVETVGIGPLITNYTRGMRDEDSSARRRAEDTLTRLAQPRSQGGLGIRLDVLETLLREHIATIVPESVVQDIPRIEAGPDGR